MGEWFSPAVLVVLGFALGWWVVERWRLALRRRDVILEVLRRARGELDAPGIQQAAADVNVPMRRSVIYVQLEHLERRGAITGRSVPGGSTRAYRDRRLYRLAEGPAAVTK